ncbi:wiskott-Aldrich syndrome protein homolog 1-like [Asterias rubens]|uniref:wiskott-Aldrich syndrome protein homolog 1-like n=1 Tax=Asterias rubens TaxID=7604 RepID=UPI0014553070|nr:wiskott-Aldrich syndrome protein homolog 1-like [Asterias rubens]
MINETKRNISEKADKEVIKIRIMEKNLLQEASDAGSRKGKTLAKLMFAKESLTSVQYSNTPCESMKILKNRQKHLHEYINIDAEEAVDLTNDLSFLSFKESEGGMTVEMGTLLLKETRWQMLTAKVGGQLNGAFSTDRLILMGQEDAPRTKPRMKPDGNILHTYNQSWLSGYLENPNSLAVNKDDHINILDGPTVKTFGSNCRLLISQFTPDEDFEPTCLAVDENNLIAVGYEDKEKVSLHNPDGSLIRTLSAPGIDKYMAMRNQRIIYTSRIDRALICVQCCSRDLPVRDRGGDRAPPPHPTPKPRGGDRAPPPHPTPKPRGGDRAPPPHPTPKHRGGDRAPPPHPTPKHRGGDRAPPPHPTPKHRGGDRAPPPHPTPKHRGGDRAPPPHPTPKPRGGDRAPPPHPTPKHRGGDRAPPPHPTPKPRGGDRAPPPHPTPKHRGGDRAPPPHPTPKPRGGDRAPPPHPTPKPRGGDRAPPPHPTPKPRPRSRYPTPKPRQRPTCTPRRQTIM